MRPLPSVELLPGRWVGDEEPCFLVAEVGQNHNGQPELARRLIESAAGADAVKFCKRCLASELTADASGRPYRGPQSFGATYGEHRQALELDIRQHAQLQAHAEAAGLTYFATACDRASVDELESLDVPCFKVASRDLTNLPLLDHMARLGKPMIVSCGMDGMHDIAAALDCVRRHHDMLVLLQCTSAYPTRFEDVNLRAMQTLRREFDVLVGFSDHTPGWTLAPVAAALGAVVVEKHVTLDRRMKGADHACSLEPDEWRNMVQAVRDTQRALGDGLKRLPPSIEPAKRKLGRSLVSRVAIPRGTRITEDMLCLKSPGDGLLWRERGAVVGRIAARDIRPDVTLTVADVSKTANALTGQTQRESE